MDDITTYVDDTTSARSLSSLCRTILQGALVLVRLPASSSPSRPKRPPKRSVVRTFSQRSRRRLLRFLHRIRWRPFILFVTLTTREIISPQEAKRHFRRWVAWFRRRYPHWGIVWKLEFQLRGAPHFHLVLIPPAHARIPYIPIGEIHDRWGLGFCWIERVPQSHISFYLAKYVAKGPGEDLDDADIAGLGVTWEEWLEGEGPSLDQSAISAQWLRDWTGRFWGRIGPIEMAKVVVDPPWLWENELFLSAFAKLLNWAKSRDVPLRGWIAILLPVQLS